MTVLDRGPLFDSGGSTSTRPWIVSRTSVSRPDGAIPIETST